MSHVPGTDQPKDPRRSHQPNQDRFRVIRPDEIEWTHLPGYPAAVRTAVLVGEPSKPGPYVIRVKLPHNTKMMPHRHTEDRVYVVISGVFYVGLGEQFDERQLTAHAPGTVVVLPSGQPHFHWAKSGEYITQVTAIGPLGLEYVDPTDDPRAPSKGQA
jgi:quercetin dioxygenase-like cupin family protein